MYRKSEAAFKKKHIFLTVRSILFGKIVSYSMKTVCREKLTKISS